MKIMTNRTVHVNKKELHLAAINGPWQLLTFINFFKTYLEEKPDAVCEVVFYEISEETVQFCKSIVVEFDFIIQTSIYNYCNPFIPKDFTALWIGKLFSIASKEIVDRHTNCPIFLFEEGAHSYIRPKLLPIIKWLKAYVFDFYFDSNRKLQWIDKSRSGNYMYPGYTLSNHQDRVRRKYYLLHFDQDNKSIIANQHFNNVLQTINTEITLEKLQKKVEVYVILGQNLHYYGLLSFNQEWEIYKKCIEKLISQCKTVIWKSHPRARDFEAAIEFTFKDKVTIFYENLIPVEIFLVKYPQIKTISISSSSLLYHKYLLKGESFQLAWSIIPSLNEKSIWYNDQKKVLELIQDKIPKFHL